MQLYIYYLKAGLALLITLFLTPLFASNKASEVDPDSTLLKKAALVNYISLQYEQGGILPAAKAEKQNILKQLDYKGFRIKAGRQFKDKTYSKLYNMPIYGIGILASTFSSDLIGNPVGVFGFFEYPVTRGKRLDLDFELDVGLAGNFKPFNNKRNPENILIGSWLNKYVSLGFRANYAINRNYSVGIGTSLKHFSNGSSQKPNLGINLTPVEVSVIYNGKGASRERNKKGIPPYQRKTLLDIYSAWGTKQFEIGGKKYTKGSLGIAYLYQNRYKTRWGLAAELFYSSSGSGLVSSTGSNFSKSMSIAIAPTFDWVFSEKFFTRWSLGIYAKRNKENDERTSFYQNIALRYNCFKNVTIGVGLKAHLGVADYCSGVVGYTFSKTKRE